MQVRALPLCQSARFMMVPTSEICSDVRAEGIVCYVDLYTEACTFSNKLVGAGCLTPLQSSSQDARPPANDTPAAPSSSSSASSTTLSTWDRHPYN